MEDFMDNFFVFGNSFDTCLFNLEKVLKRCEEPHLILNWENCHFMVQEEIILGPLSESGTEVDRVKIETIERLPPPFSMKAIRSFLGYVRFYRRFIKDFSKITKPLTALPEKDMHFNFDDNCLATFNLIKEKLTKSPIVVSPDLVSSI